MTPDRDVVLASLAEPHAFGELFDRHARRIHRFIARRVGDAAADDVVAETFLRAFERRHRFDTGRDDALPWLFGIAVNVLRHRQREDLRLLPADAERPDDRDGIGAAGRRIDAERRLAAVLEEVRRMPAGTRDVLLLHLWAELSHEDVAEALGIAVGTVKSRLNRARARLRALEENGAPRGQDRAAAHLP